MAALTSDVTDSVQPRKMEPADQHAGSTHAAAKVLVALAAAVGAWQILVATDPARAAVQVLMAAGVAVLVATLLFAREIIAILRPTLYAALVVLLVVWLVLAYGVTQWQWGLLAE